MLKTKERPMRVLHVIGIMDRGGAEAMIMNLYRNIDREQVQFDFAENTFTEGAYDEEIRHLGGRIFNCPHFNGKNYLQYRAWWKTFFRKHKGEYGIVHGHIGSCASIYLSEAKNAGIFTIAHSHNSFQSLPYKLMAYRTRFIAEWFFGCSKIAAEDRYGKRIANSNRCRVLPNAIDTECFKFDRDVRFRIRKEFDMETAQVIGHVGRFVEQKNHTFLLAVFQEYLRKNPDLKLLMIGDGPLRENIQKEAEERGIVGNCIFTGVIGNVNELMLAMDLLLMPSLYEGLPVTLVEAQTSGLPCLMSYGVPEESILIPEICGRLSLKDEPDSWCREIERLSELKRSDRTAEITEAGYNIHQTAEWLKEFYLEHGR